MLNRLNFLSRFSRKSNQKENPSGSQSMNHPSVNDLLKYQQAMQQGYMQQALGNSGMLSGLMSSEEIAERNKRSEERHKKLLEKITALGEVEPQKLTCRVPDRITTIIGWRGWVISNGKLAALGVSGIWEPLAKAAATCTTRGCWEAPQENCKCGYWSFNTLDLLQEVLKPYSEVAVIGQVEIWGKVIECENGYRSEFAYPKELWLLKDGLEHLSWTYKVPIRKL